MLVVIKASNNVRYMIEFFGHETIQDLINILKNEFFIDPDSYFLQKETNDSTLSPQFTLAESGITDKCHLILKFKEETDDVTVPNILPKIESSKFNQIPRKQINPFQETENSSNMNQMTSSNKQFYDSLTQEGKASIDRLHNDFSDINYIIDLSRVNENDENITRSYLQDFS